MKYNIVEEISISYCIAKNLMVPICVFVGLLADQAGQGHLQTQHHQLLRADQRQPDAEHHHVKTGQAQEGSLRPTIGKESRKQFVLFVVTFGESGISFLEAYEEDAKNLKK